jgi:hypothetical protein
MRSVAIFLHVRPLIIKKIFGQQNGEVYLNPQSDLVIEAGQSVSKEITIARKQSGSFHEMIQY